MNNEKIKYTITAYVPGTVCNLRCKYCYISNCIDESHIIKPSYYYPLDTMIKAFSRKRLGGIVEVTVISGGETLTDSTIVPFIHGLLKEGHVVTVVTNLTLNKRIDELLDIEEKYLKRLIVKGSLHWLELKRLNKVDDYFDNMKKILSKGASSYPFLVLSEDYMQYVDEICEKSMKEIGALPQCSPNMYHEEKEDIIRHDKAITKPECNKEFVEKINKKFNSNIFKTCVKFLDVNVEKIFCYAGKWSFGVNLKDGGLIKCHGCRVEGNFYSNLDTLPELSAIGSNCQIANCALQYNFVALGLIPEVDSIMRYSEVLNSKTINDEVKKLLDVRFDEIYEQYSKKQKSKINKKLKKQYCESLLKKIEQYCESLFKKIEFLFRFFILK